MLKVPLGLAAEIIFEEFSKKSPGLLGDYTSPVEYVKFFVHTYTDVYRERDGWVVVASEPRGHSAEIHAYAFDHAFRDKREFFQAVIQDLALKGKIRLWTTLMPRAGHLIRQELRALGFQYEGILRSFYWVRASKGFADGELWARIALDQGVGDGQQ